MKIICNICGIEKEIDSNLTPKEKENLKFIKNFQKEYSISPSFRGNNEGCWFRFYV